MSSKTKIIVLHMKEIIYTGIFAGLAIVLAILLFIMFRPNSKATASIPDTTAITYTPGVYCSTVTLDANQVNIEVTVDQHRITSITLVPLNESITTMYPLVAPALKDLASQICKNQSLENLSYPSESKYTSMVLMKAIEKALSKAHD